VTVRATRRSSDVAISPGGKRVAWVEIRANVVLGGFDFRRYSAAHPGSDIDSSIEQPGAIALFDATTAAPVRDLTDGPKDLFPSFAPNAKAVAFERGGAVWSVPARGGKAKRLLRRARQPTWSR
jgi:dipeptidyl aminopeptidase/acylaminoacyl peptidase